MSLSRFDKIKSDSENLTEQTSRERLLLLSGTFNAFTQRPFSASIQCKETGVFASPL